MTYLSVDDLKKRDGEILPLKDDGSLDAGKVMAALEDASGIIRTYLPSLAKKTDGSFPTPPARLADSLKPITRDLAVYYLTRVNGEEDARKRYDSAISMLRALAGGGDESGSTPIGGDAEPEIVEGMSGFLKGSL